MHADGVSEAKRYAAGDNEEEEGAPGQKHWPEGDGQESHRADPERLRRHQRTLPSSGSVSSFAKMRSEPGIKFIATRFAPVEVAVASCARLACMSIRWDADGEADHRGAVAFG